MTKLDLQGILCTKLTQSYTAKPGLGRCWFKHGVDWSEYCIINKERGHRYVYKLINGPIKKGYVICHKCDRPGCIRPDHLFQGTNMDNFRDAIKKGIIPKPSKRISPKLREQDRIRQLVRFAGE